MVETPSLAAQLADSDTVLGELVAYMARRIAGPEGESLADEVIDWMRQNLGAGYTWPGNYRELEQCVKNVLIRRNYRPIRSAPANPLDEFSADARAGRLTAEDLLRRYVTIVYAAAGSYDETARRLGMDRRTVKTKVDEALLQRLRAR
jgi:DNA-binding NtrC family response regulator